MIGAGQGDEFWPIWRATDDVDRLARYASREALRLTKLMPRASDDAPSLLYERLRAARIRYIREPDILRSAQRPRHPDWLLSEGGTCLDLALAYCAMCLQAGIAPLLAITSDHAFVIADLDPGSRRAGRFGAAYAEPDSDGSSIVRDVSAIARRIDSGVLVAVDCVAACTDIDAGFDTAREHGSERIDAGLVLIDVAWLQARGGVPALEPPGSWPTIRRHLPGGRLEHEPFDDQAAAFARAAGRTGMIVIAGSSGVGKSAVGRRLVEADPQNAGWFLTATDRAALIDSLASAELAERRTADSVLERPDREALALVALRRLGESPFGWTIVLDNADAGPQGLTRFLPRPSVDRGQRLVVTTVRPDLWEAHSDGPTIELRGADDAEVERRLGVSEITRHVAGRALLVDAFARLLASTSKPLTTLEAPPAPTDELSGPLLFWTALQEALPGEAVRRLAAVAAYLPPDAVPATEVERAAGADGSMRVLADHGLFAVSTGTTTTMHRLFGRAILSALADDTALLGEATTIVATDDELAASIARDGDLDGVERLAERAMELGEDDEAPLSALRALRGCGRLFELRGDTARSASTYAALLPRLDGGEPAHRGMLAECLHSRARVAFRDHKDDETQLKGGLKDAQRAFELAGGDAAGARAGRFLAMQGLIRRALAKRDTPGERDQLRRSIEVLLQADDLRGELPEDDLERIRSRFNLAGTYLRLAQVEPEFAAAHLTSANDVYTDVAERRRRAFGDVEIHPQIAPCVQGRGLVAYYRAILLAEDMVERSEQLRQASDWIVRALDQWRRIEADDGTESAKAAGYLAKVMLARHTHPAMPDPRIGMGFRRVHGRIDGLATDVVEELRADLVRRTG